MEGRWEDRCIFSGIGLSAIERRSRADGVSLAVEAARAAIADAGLDVDDIDGVATVGEAPLTDVVAAVGLTPTWTGDPLSSVGGSMAGVHDACRAVAAGRARHVLVYRSVAMMGGNVASGGQSEAAAAARRALQAEMPDLDELVAYHAYSAVNWVAMHARRHMHLYGTTREQMGWVAVSGRRHASRNPRAIYRDPFTIEDYLAARMISDPLGLLDCDVPVDGACAFVVSVPAHAAGCPRPAVRVEAAARVGGPGGWTRRSDYPRMASADAANELWRRTDLTPGDLDVAQLYDGFSFLTLTWLEALGICAPGESGAFVEGGERISVGGQLPLNTYGGQLSAGRLHGHWVLHEACTQLRGDGGQRQVPGAEVAVISTGGGPVATCMLLTR